MVGDVDLASVLPVMISGVHHKKKKNISDLLVRLMAMILSSGHSNRMDGFL